MRRTNSATLVVVLVASFVAAKVAQAETLCCELYNAAQCAFATNGVCPVPDASHPAWITVAVVQPIGPNTGAAVGLRVGPPFEGLCFADHGAVGQYVAPKWCYRLTAPSGLLVSVSENYVPFGGNAFAVETTATFANLFAGGLYTSCFNGAGQRDDNGVATYGVGSGYTCSPLRQMTWGAGGGVYGGSVHYLPTVNFAPALGTKPRLSTTTPPNFQVEYNTTFQVRTAAPNSPVYWNRTINGVAQPVVQIGYANAYGSVDHVWQEWTLYDVGTNTFSVSSGSTSNTLTFTVIP